MDLKWLFNKSMFICSFVVFRGKGSAILSKYRSDEQLKPNVKYFRNGEDGNLFFIYICMMLVFLKIITMYIRNILCRGLLLTVILSLFSCEKDNEDLDCKYEKDYAPCGIEWMGDDLIVREEGNRRLTLVNSVSL